jgi:nitrite reductase/ring-hydroxylating ferredoxin subunit
VICRTGDLSDGGRGIRFQVRRDGETVPAFIIRHQGKVHAYFNRCAHRHVELDWNPGDFFDAQRRYLICATHGAIYEPDSGACAGGRCRGEGGLIPLSVSEHDGLVFLEGGDELHL